jgi:predicted ATPase
MHSVSLPGYRVERILRRDRSSAVYEARRVSDGVSVIAKFRTSSSDGPGPLQDEFDLLRGLQVEGTPRAVDLVRAGREWALLMECCEGVELQVFADHRPLPLATFLEVAPKIAVVVAAIHGRRVMLRDLKPSSILVHPETREVCVVDFGLSRGSLDEAGDSGDFSGTLAYLAPEQSGRMSRRGDYRSDLYSLGVIFYELLAGRRPFTSTDPLALLHAHLAMRPPRLGDLRPEVPQVLAELVEKLLSKDPSDRYQSAGGLLSDLERCRDALTDGRIASFSLGSEDRPLHFTVSQRLFGREQERAQLVEAFERAREGEGIAVLVEGAGGMGKTTLVEALHGAVVEGGGRFVRGKHGQQRSEVPFVGLRQAMAELFDMLRFEDRATEEHWRERLRGGLGPLAGALRELNPDFERLFGTVAPLPPVPPLESSNRLLLAVQRLLRAVASPESPLVLFLDDLQWMDRATAWILDRLCDEKLPGFVLVGAARPVETPDGHPLTELRRRFSSEIVLGALGVEAVEEIVADSLRVEVGETRELSGLISRRSRGNPMLMGQQLGYLERLDLLRPDTSSRPGRGFTWKWDLSKIRNAGLPDDAGVAMRERFGGLSPEQRELLSAASCVGGDFDLPSLAAALEDEPEGLRDILQELRDEGLVTESVADWRFGHDRVEEIAREALSEDEARVYHGRIGRFREEKIDLTQSPERVFDVVDHLNLAHHAPLDEARGRRLAELNLLAGTRAAMTTAFDTAENYLRRGLDALSGRDPSLEQSLLLEQARCRGLGGDEAGAYRMLDLLLERALSPADRTRVHLVRVQLLSLFNRVEEALEWGLRGLGEQGLHFPGKAGKVRAAVQVLEVRRLARRLAGRLDELPPCTDPLAEMQHELLTRLHSPAFFVAPERLVEITLTQLKLLRRRGHTSHAASAVSAASVILASALGEHRFGAALAEEGVRHASKHHSPVEGRVRLNAATLTHHWVHPYRACRLLLEPALERNLEVGDLEYAAYSITTQSFQALAAGLPLPEILGAAIRAHQFLGSAGIVFNADLMKIIEVFCRYLQGEAKLELAGADPLDTASLERTTDRCAAAGLHLILGAVMGETASAKAMGDRWAPRIHELLQGLLNSSEILFYHALCTAMTLREGGWKSRGYLTLRRAHRRFCRWARLCGENFAHRALLLGAEKARIRGRFRRAQVLYEKAVGEARRHRCLVVEALALERFGRHLVSQGLRVSGVGALREARGAYAAWGALAKVRRLEEEWPELVEPAMVAEEDTPSSSTSGSGEQGQLDLMTVIKGTQALTRALDHDEVVERLLTAAVENAGGQRGALILDREGELRLEALHDLEGEEALPSPMALDRASSWVPVELLRDVAATQQLTLVNDVAEEPRLRHDPYLSGSGTRSLLAVPIVTQGRLMGILYLENLLATHVFSPARVELLRILAAQAAISLENTRLFEAQRKSEEQ